MIPVPVGRSYSATYSGLVWRTVRCEFCGCDFAYQLFISGYGSGFSPLFLGNSAASGDAQLEARSHYRQLARTAIGMAPCPDCGRYQSKMIREERKERWSVAGAVALILATTTVISLLPTRTPTGITNIAVYLCGGTIALAVITRWDTFILVAVITLFFLILQAFLTAAAYPIVLVLCVPWLFYRLWRVFSLPDRVQAPLSDLDLDRHHVFRRTEIDEIRAQMTPEEQAKANLPDWSAEPKPPESWKAFIR
jgi:hypothetical protein